MRKAQNRIWDFCWYAFITTVFVGSALYAAIADVHWHLFMRWFGFAFLTFFLFGFFLEANRPQWKQRSFWYWTAFLFCVHSGAFVFYAFRGANWSGRGLSLALVIEGVLLAVFKDWMFGDSATKKA